MEAFSILMARHEDFLLRKKFASMGEEYTSFLLFGQRHGIKTFLNTERVFIIVNDSRSNYSWKSKGCR